MAYPQCSENLCFIDFPVLPMYMYKIRAFVKWNRRFCNSFGSQFWTCLQFVLFSIMSSGYTLWSHFGRVFSVYCLQFCLLVTPFGEIMQSFQSSPQLLNPWFVLQVSLFGGMLLMNRRHIEFSRKNLRKCGLWKSNGSVFSTKTISNYWNISDSAVPLAFPLGPKKPQYPRIPCTCTCYVNKC